MSHWSLWTSRKPNDTETPALHSGLLASVLHAARRSWARLKSFWPADSLPEQFAGAARVFHTLGSVIQIRKPPRIRAASKQAQQLCSTCSQHCTPPPRRRMPLHLYDGTSAACTKKEMADNRDAFEAHVNKRICDHSCERRPCIRRVAAMAWRSITWRSAIRRRRDGLAPTQ